MVVLVSRDRPQIDSAYNKRIGHALHILPPELMAKPKKDEAHGRAAKPSISPAIIRSFCGELGVPEQPASKVVRDTVANAVQKWPLMIAESLLTEQQKDRLLPHFKSHVLVESLTRRHGSHGAKAPQPR